MLSNLTKTQNSLLLSSFVLIAVHIVVSFFLMIYSTQKNTNPRVITSFWFISFVVCVAVFILIIFIFKKSEDKYPCPLSISEPNDSNRDDVEKTINIFNKSNSKGGLKPYDKNRKYIIASKYYFSKINKEGIETPLPQEIAPFLQFLSMVNVLPIAYIGNDGNIYNLKGDDIINL